MALHVGNTSMDGRFIAPCRSASTAALLTRCLKLLDAASHRQSSLAIAGLLFQQQSCDSYNHDVLPTSCLRGNEAHGDARPGGHQIWFGQSIKHRRPVVQYQDNNFGLTEAKQWLNLPIDFLISSQQTRTGCNVLRLKMHPFSSRKLDEMDVQSSQNPVQKRKAGSDGRFRV